MGQHRTHVERTALELLNDLIDRWPYWDSNETYYLTVLAPGIVRYYDGTGKLTNERGEPVAEILPEEQRILNLLKELLYPEEWGALPTLMEEHRAGTLKELCSDRDRASAKQEEERERRRREDELRKAREAEERARAEAEEAEERERERQDRVRRQAKKALKDRLIATFNSDFLSADEVLASDPDRELISEEYSDLKTRFVCQWAERELRPFLVTADSKPCLDPEQAAAVAATGGDTQAVARAGSGKTRTLVARAIFLQRHCRVSPREILLLAFNKSAAKEMKGRLLKALDKDAPHVMTFHALAYALVKPEGTLLRDDPSGDTLALSGEIQKVIDEHIRSPAWGDRIQRLMLAHFREDWERIVNGRLQLPGNELLAYRRALPRQTLKGELVKSFGEKLIANALFEHDVKYKYERNYRWNEKNLRHDFAVEFPESSTTGLKRGVVIEYFGNKDDPDYDPAALEKREFWIAHKEWEFLEFRPSDIERDGVEAFVDALVERLCRAGVPARRLSEGEIWERVMERAVDGFTRAMTTFIGRCRKANLKPEDLERRVKDHNSCTVAEDLFLGVAPSIYRGYRDRLCQESGNFDDHGVMWEAIQAIRDGKTSFERDKGKEQGDVAKLRYILVDEFQDFSQAFFEVCMAIRSVNPNVQFFCVGDDWQAINRFAGSDLRFFHGFPTDFQNPSRCYVRTNYRSAKAIVQLGNTLMKGLGEDARPARDAPEGEAWLCSLDRFRPTAVERGRHNAGDVITPAVLRLVRYFLDWGLDVALLARRHGLPWYVSWGEDGPGRGDALQVFKHHICSFLPVDDHERITASTVHGYKGLEESAVIILDVVERSYPLIHPHWVFNRIFGEEIHSIEEEERRLLYVAITRAKTALALVTEHARQSPFLAEIRTLATPLSWDDLSPVVSLSCPRLEIRVSGDTYEVKDTLNDLGYDWEQTGQYWSKAMLAKGFSLKALLSETWISPGIRIEIYSEKGNLVDNWPTRGNPR